jgi:fermentation-respiration switch protein FrsA (DUF1100 family)
MDMGLVGINPTDGTAETAGMTSGTTLGAMVEEPTGTTLGATEEEPTGTTLGAGTVLGATADIMVTVATVVTAVSAASAAITDGTTKDGAEPSLAAVAPAEAVSNLPLTTEFGASKSNRE